MHELIYRFLLEAGFSRASLVSLAEPVFASPYGLIQQPSQVSTGAQRASSFGVPSNRRSAFDEHDPDGIDSTEKYRRFFFKRSPAALSADTSGKSTPEATAETTPAYLVIDPETADLLAVINVIESDSETELKRQQGDAVRYAAEFGDELTQAYLIQLLPGENSGPERVHFYHVLNTDRLQSVSAYAFPDLDTLRAHRLRAVIQHKTTSQPKPEPPQNDNPPGAGRVYFLALLLLLLGVGDWWLLQQRDAGLFSVAQSLLVIAACALFAAPALSLRYRRGRKRH